METGSSLEQELRRAIEATTDELETKVVAFEALEIEVDRLQGKLMAYEDALAHCRMPADGDAPEATTTASQFGRFSDADLASLSMAQMAAMALEKAGERLSAGDIHERLIEMGWEPTANASLPSLRTALYREHDKPDGLIVRSKEEKGKFELRKWHDADAASGEGDEDNAG